jgi:hypothetical protein
VPTFHRYSISNKKRLIDSEPIKRGEPPLVWLKDKHEWIEMDLGSGEHVDSMPITDEEAQIICETDEIPRNEMTLLRGDEGPEKKRNR